MAPVPILRSLSRKPRRRRSFGGSDDRLDSLLERSIVALEASNALLQSSLVTHSSLSTVLADSTFDRSMDAQIKFLSRRFAAEEEREAGLDHVLDGVTGLIDTHIGSSGGDGNQLHSREDSFSRSLPAEDHMAMVRSSIPRQSDEPPPSNKSQQRRLRLSADGQRPRSPPPRPFTQYVSIESPNGFALEATAPESAIYLPSTSGIRSTPKSTSFSSPPPSALATPAIGKSQSEPPHTPKSPFAHDMLTRIASSASASSRAQSPEAIRSLFTHLPKASNKLFASQDSSVSSDTLHDRGRPDDTSSSPSTTKTWPQRLFDPKDAEAGRSHHRPHASTSSAPPASSSVLDLQSSIERPSDGDDQVGKAQPDSFAITASLRKILADADKHAIPPMSEVASGKQRADGERPGFSPPRRSRSASAHLRPAALGAFSSPSASRPIVYRGERSASDRILEPPLPFLLEPPTSLGPKEGEAPASPSDTPRSSMSALSTPRRSALKGASGRSTPVSSGRSSPFNVTFSPLPPKHETDGTFGRAKAKGSLKERSSKGKGKELDKGGWWAQWLLGTPGGGGGGDKNSFTPIHTRNGSMIREEGRWAGGLESWQA